MKITISLKKYIAEGGLSVRIPEFNAILTYNKKNVAVRSIIPIENNNFIVIHRNRTEEQYHMAWISVVVDVKLDPKYIKL